MTFGDRDVGLVVVGDFVSADDLVLVPHLHVTRGDDVMLVGLGDTVGFDIGGAFDQPVGAGDLRLLAAIGVGADRGGLLASRVGRHRSRDGVVRLGHGQREGEFGPALRQRGFVRSGA